MPETNQLTHNIKESRIKTLLRRSKGHNHEVLFHHRFSTSTADVPNACHPFSTKNVFPNNYVGVHNGVIHNPDVLQKQHIARGIKYVSTQSTGEFNDSEALIYDLARYLEGEVDELTAQGSIAFIIIKRNNDGKETKLFFGRNSGNPLKMKKTKNSLTLSSQGEGVDVKPNTLYSYDYETGELDTRYLYIPYYSYNTYSSGSGCYLPSWQEREDEEEFEAYNGYGTWNTKKASKIIEDTEFAMYTGTQDKIETDLLDVHNGDFESAAIDALVEAANAQDEEDRLNSGIYHALSSEDYDELCDYWFTVNTYKGMMTEISKKFERASNTLSSGIVVSEDEKCLLPLNLETT